MPIGGGHPGGMAMLQNPQPGVSSGGAALTTKNAPPEQIREWVHIALKREDCRLLGHAMGLAAESGVLMASLLGPFLDKAATMDPSISVEMTRAMPRCTAWIDEGSGHGQFLIIKRIVNGEISFFSNKAFETSVTTCDALLQSTREMAHAARPFTELILHPEDSKHVSTFVDQLWRNLAPVASEPLPVGGELGPTEITCLREVPFPVRVWVASHGTYVHCSGRAQVVVTRKGSLQTSHTVFSFQRSIASPLQPIPAAPVHMYSGVPVATRGVPEAPLPGHQLLGAYASGQMSVAQCAMPPQFMYPWFHSSSPGAYMPIAPDETGIANGNGQMNGHMHGHANEMPVLAAGQQGNTFTDANEKPVLAAGQQGNTFTNANEMPVLAAGQQGSAFYLDDAKS
eukprot:CAMPEP_0172604316 /NCGR_PEP_ID=MMETSP1068-20121228/24561_1 /TAXON_ID=35684 /ORGANISM="Pseudopedinella elastica, Strain CCMP716" /LENGTH=397 /DNA_ID=CAMNT_0013406337 /DNA_START=107 /DNA_END=1300 /DNA_ORIENTATION=+